MQVARGTGVNLIFFLIPQFFDLCKNQGENCEEIDRKEKKTTGGLKFLYNIFLLKGCSHNSVVFY